MKYETGDVYLWITNNALIIVTDTSDVNIMAEGMIMYHELSTKNSLLENHPYIKIRIKYD